MPGSSVVRLRVVVHGRVQGVYFRAECREAARAHRVSGWVSNQPDGTVYAEFEGPKDAVDAMVGWCRTGPDRAHVTDVAVTELAPTGEAGFSVH
ncbi:MAG TPA: acylphosphatase [Aeromicrobium sp.]|nr:acylphosphatase [Aeromicrobium sp.]